MASSSDEQNRRTSEVNQRIASRDLAALIVDALVDAGIVSKEDTERAIRIATEEIDVRKALGDY